MTEARRIIIFDTTLRDGEQSPGASMNLTEKMEIAQALQDLGVDVIEAGFPIASPGDFEAVREIAATIRNVSVCGLARCNDKDIDRAWEALKIAEQPRIHVFLATSAIHREFKLKMTCDEIIQRAVDGVKLAASYCDDVEFSPEDAVRTEHDFLCQVVEAAIRAGARTVNIPDTVGYATPAQMGATIAMLRNRVPNIDQAVISVHCHNDLGLAVANSLAAVEHGAGQIECTINGIGERAGNCSLEEVVMAMRTRNDVYHCETAVNTRRLVPTSRLVSEHHRPAGPAEQGHRRPQRLRPRSGHPPGRHAQGTHHLRDHASGRRRLLEDRPGAGQAQRPRGAWPIAPKCSAIDSPANNCSRSSRNSRDWPTRRKKSTTAISWR